MKIIIRLLKRILSKTRQQAYQLSYMSAKNLLSGKDVYIEAGSSFQNPKTIIGNHTRINGPIRIIGFQEVHIGKYCALGSGITVITTNHKTQHANIQVYLQRQCGFSSLVQEDSPVKIGNNVWIGDNATILPGVKIGDGAIVGAAGVVTKDVPAFSIAVGSPAKVVKNRFAEDIIAELAEIKWWQWPIDKIKNNRLFFETDLSALSSEEIRSLIEKS